MGVVRGRGSRNSALETSEYSVRNPVSLDLLFKIGVDAPCSRMSKTSHDHRKTLRSQSLFVINCTAILTRVNFLPSYPSSFPSIPLAL